MYDHKPYLKKINDVIQQGPYHDTWESLGTYKVPEWYRNAKFGIFLHWGIYSVPAFANEWYSRNMYIQGTREFEHHVSTYGPHKQFGYKDFIPMFKAEHFDPDAWAELFTAAGAKYVLPVAEHHDGFQMYRSDLSHWNAFEMGPKRDILGELRTSLEKNSLLVGCSTHRIEHWFFMSHGREFESDIHDPMNPGDFYWPAMPEPKDHHDLYAQPVPTDEFLEDWMIRTCELIDRYEPKVLYFDWWIQEACAKPYLKKIAAYYYNSACQKGREVVINYKHDAFMFGTAVPDVERGQFAETKPYVWQTDTAAAYNSWCYTLQNKYKPAEDLVRDLVDIVSKNGNLLLNVGPKPDGTFTEEDTAILKTIGSWLQVNGESIYASRPWRMYGEGPTKVVEGQFADNIRKSYTSDDFRFTTANGALYAFAMGDNEEGKYTIKALGEQDASRVANFHGIIRKISLLGSNEMISWSRDSEGLHIHTQAHCKLPLVFKIEID
ncbi:MAG: alpha-L-fucosidase [Clostridia bacterium]|nr:alpha-L-fucosidase [Clostridia bacterium]